MIKTQKLFFSAEMVSLTPVKLLTASISNQPTPRIRAIYHQNYILIHLLTGNVILSIIITLKYQLPKIRQLEIQGAIKHHGQKLLMLVYLRVEDK